MISRKGKLSLLKTYTPWMQCNSFFWATTFFRIALKRWIHILMEMSLFRLTPIKCYVFNQVKIILQKFRLILITTFYFRTFILKTLYIIYYRRHKKDKNAVIPIIKNIGEKIKYSSISNECSVIILRFWWKI